MRPPQQRSKQKQSSAQSMPQLTDQLRQEGNAVQLASAAQSDSTNTAAAAGCSVNSMHKVGKVRKRPSSHNCFTAEMDLAAAGLLGQAPRATAEVRGSNDKLQQGLSWPVRNRHTQQQQATSISAAGRLDDGELPLSRPQQQQQRQQQHQQQQQHHHHQDREQGGWQRATRHQQFEVPGQGDNAGPLSPGAKKMLRLVGLLSEEQVSEAHCSACTCLRFPGNVATIAA